MTLSEFFKKENLWNKRHDLNMKPVAELLNEPEYINDDELQIDWQLWMSIYTGSKEIMIQSGRDTEEEYEAFWERNPDF